MCCHNPLLSKQRECSLSAKKEMVPASEEDVIADLMEQHDLFASSMQSRLAKLQVVIVVIEVYRSWISACRQDRKIVLCFVYSHSHCIYVKEYGLCI